MYALMIAPITNSSVIVSMQSREFAELSVAGYVPIREGTKRDLIKLEDDLMPEYETDLELNQYN